MFPREQRREKIAAQMARENCSRYSRTFRSTGDASISPIEDDCHDALRNAELGGRVLGHIRRLYVDVRGWTGERRSR
jgi:hypothetical protein